MNVIARLEFELAYYGVAIQHINHYVTRAPPHLIYLTKLATKVPYS